jgi:hypothetical protein
MKLEAAGSSEMLILIDQNVQHHIAKDCDLIFTAMGTLNLLLYETDSTCAE